VRFPGGIYAGINRPASKSNVLAIGVLTRIAIAIPKTWIHGARENVRIAVLPKLKGRPVTVQLDGRTIAKVKTTSSGQVAVAMTVNQAGRHKLTVVVPASSQNVKTTKTVTITVQ
jgi:hypothetical protein